MEYRELRASAAACHFIDRLWMLEDDGEHSTVQRVVPDGCAELIVNLGEPYEAYTDGEWRRQSNCFVAGQITGPLMLRSNGPAKILGIRFRPHGARQALRVEMHEITRRFPHVADLMPALYRDISRATDSPDPLRAIESALRHSAGDSGESDHIVAEAVRRSVHSAGACDIAAMARDLGLSTRQLERRFRNVVGLTPKLFCRIQRFHRVFQEIEASRNWVTAAQECGYYDQSHLVNDFREFAGQPPATLLTGDELARHFI